MLKAIKKPVRITTEFGRQSQCGVYQKRIAMDKGKTNFNVWEKAAVFG